VGIGTDAFTALTTFTDNFCVVHVIDFLEVVLTVTVQNQKNVRTVDIKNIKVSLMEDQEINRDNSAQGKFYSRRREEKN